MCDDLDNPTVSFKINVGIDVEKVTEESRTKFTRAFSKGHDISDYLLTAGQASGSALAMQDIGIGEWGVETLRQIEWEKDGVTQHAWVLGLHTGIQVWAKGRVGMLLRSTTGWVDKQIELGTIVPDARDEKFFKVEIPLTLKVSSIKEKANGVSVGCQLVTRQAAIEATDAGQAQLEPAKEPVKNEESKAGQVDPKKELAEIPF